MRGKACDVKVGNRLWWVSRSLDDTPSYERVDTQAIRVILAETDEEQTASLSR